MVPQLKGQILTRELEEKLRKMLPLKDKIVKKIKVKDLHFFKLFYKHKNNIENIIKWIKEKITHDPTFSNEILDLKGKCLILWDPLSL